jgi:hypothetical protein
MGDWRPDLQETKGWRIYLWVVPAAVAGRWRMRSGERRLDLMIDQKFQQFYGTAAEAGGTVPLRNTRLRGGAIEFITDAGAAADIWRGTVDGDRMHGRSDAGAAWSATRS